MDSKSKGNIRRRVAAGAAALSIALAGAAWAGCGDDNAEQAVDEAAQEAEQTADDVGQEAEEAVDDAAGEAEEQTEDSQGEDSQGEDPGY